MSSASTGATVAFKIVRGEEGRQILEGTRLSDDRAFRLVVETDRRVRGVIGAKPVRFRAPR